MRKFVSYFFALASCAAFFAGCTKEINNQEPNITGTHKVTFVSDQIDTKTQVVEGNTEASYIWNSGDAQYLHVYENGIEATDKSLSLDATGSVGTISATFNNTSATTFVYKAYYYSEKTNTGNPKVLEVQNPKANSFDPKTDVLISDETTAGPAQSELKLRFGRVAVVSKMTLKGMTAGEVVSKVTLTGSAALNGSYAEASTNQETGDPIAAHWNAGTKKLVFESFENATVDENGEFPIYFVSIPFEGTISISVTTDQNQYDRDDITTTLKFEVGKMARFGLKLNGYGAPIETGATYSAVSSIDDFVDGASYLIVGVNSDEYYAMSAQSANGNNRTSVVVPFDSENSTITVSTDIKAYPIKIESTTGGYYLIDNNPDSANYGHYLYNGSTSGSNAKSYLRSKETAANDCVWTISISEGKAVFTNVGNTSRNIIRFNTSNVIFNCYASGQADVQLFIDPDSYAEDTTPRIETTPESITGVSYKGGADYDNITFELKYLEGATAAISCDGTVVTEADEVDGTIIYSVSKNTGDAREGWIKITAGEVVKQVSVSQGAAPAYDITLGNVTDGKVFVGANESDDITFSVKSNYLWEATLSYTGGVADSFLIDPEDGNADDEVDHVTTITITAFVANETSSERLLGTITIDNGGASTTTVQVWQSAPAATPQPEGAGSWNDPYNAAKALEVAEALADNANSDYVYVSGTVTGSIDMNTTQFYNATYYIASGNATIEVYRGKNFNGTNFTSTDQLEEGDVVTVYGQLKKYVSGATTTLEMNTGSYLFSRNGEIHLVAPEVTATGNNAAKTIAVSWNSVDGATSYDVTCGTLSQTGLTTTSYTFTMPDYGTYSVQVTAKGAVGAVDGVSEVKSVTLTNPDAGIPSPETITFSESKWGLENGVQYLDPFDGGHFTVTFAGGDNDGKYYTTGTGMRVYGGGSLTIASSYNISEIEFTWYGSSYKPTADVANPTGYSSSTNKWTGKAKSIVMTRPSGSGHWRLQSIKVTYSE